MVHGIFSHIFEIYTFTYFCNDEKYHSNVLLILEHENPKLLALGYNSTNSVLNSLPSCYLVSLFTYKYVSAQTLHNFYLLVHIFFKNTHSWCVLAIVGCSFFVDVSNYLYIIFKTKSNLFVLCPLIEAVLLKKLLLIYFPHLFFSYHDLFPHLAHNPG